MTPEMIEQWAREAGADWFGDIGASFIPKLCAIAFAAGAEAMRRDALLSAEANEDLPGVKRRVSRSIRALPLPKE